MKTLRILSLLLCLLTLLATLVACDGNENETDNAVALEDMTPEEICAYAAEKMAGQKYAMSMKMSYSSDNEMMNMIFSSMSDMDTKINVDGNNYSVSVSLMGVNADYIFVDKTVYIDMMGEKQKAELSDEEYDELVKSMLGSAAADVSALSGFATVEALKHDDGRISIIGKGVSGEKNELIDSITGEVGSEESGVNVTIDQDTLENVMEIDADGNFKSVKVHVDMVMTAEGLGNVNVSADVELTYDFTTSEAVIAPADADRYTTVPVEEIMGE